MSAKALIFRPLALIVVAAIPGSSHAAAQVGGVRSAGLPDLDADIGVRRTSTWGAGNDCRALLCLGRGVSDGTGVNWHGNRKLFQGGLPLDVFPLAGRFSLAGGVVRESNKIRLSARPSGSSYTSNGNTYPAREVAAAEATVVGSKASPYSGVGWGNRAGPRSCTSLLTRWCRSRAARRRPLP